VSEWKLFEGSVPHVSTAAFHADRERAPHLEQEWHQGRLRLAAQFVTDAVCDLDPPTTVSDLGCGDGGLLSLVQAYTDATCWGYDFQPSNAAGWAERGVTAELADVFGADRSRVRVGDVGVMTEVLEHLADPHGVLRWVRQKSWRLVCSSPVNETDRVHDACHAWAWDREGYAAMIEEAGWDIVRHEQTELFQVVLAR
jgi:trans-aconitate methyltransferase